MTSPMEQFENERSEAIARIERKAQLAPVLANLILEAKNVYDILRPKAVHVSEVGLDFPLRHQQLHGFNINGFQQIGDYIMIRLRDQDNITIQQQVAAYDDAWLWSIDHSRQIDVLRSDQTHIGESSGKLLRADERINLRAGIYEYPEEWGHNSYFRGDPCDYYDGYPNAEERVEGISADLKAALELHG